MDADTATTPWQRQADESGRAYAAFAAYRDTPPAQRSQRALAATLGRNLTLVSRWSVRHRWVQRLVAFDDEQDRGWRAKLASERDEAARRHAQAAQRAQELVLARLDALDADELSVAEMVRLWDVAVRIERDALGEPARHELSGPAGGPLQLEVDRFAGMPAEQRLAVIAGLVGQVQRRLTAPSADDDDP